MRLKAKLLVVAAIPLLLSLALIAAAVLMQQRELARREHALVEGGYLSARQVELRNYVQLAMNMVAPLVDSPGDPQAAQSQALKLLADMQFGDDGYFFVYDLHGKVLMHPRQLDLVGKDLWDLRDPQGNATIQRLLARARAGGGFVEYMWRRPSTGRIAPKLGYVTQIPRWGWMIGTGLYRDDIDSATTQLDAQASSNIGQTLLWIAVIACGGVALISLSGLWLNLSEHRVADAKLQTLARQVVRFQEDERAHLARELHDGATQTMVSAKLLVESAIDQLEREDRAAPRVLDKALANVAKHARAQRVELNLHFAEAGVSLDIRDDGRGFELARIQLDPNRGIGLRNMRERLASIGGRFEVHAAPGEGTLLQATVSGEAIRRLG